LQLYYAEQQERKRLEACLEEAHQDVTALYRARHKLEQTIAEQRVALLNAEKGEMGELESVSAASSSSSPHVKVGRNENASGDATPAKKLRDEAIALRDKMRQMKQQGMEKESIVIDQIRWVCFGRIIVSLPPSPFPLPPSPHLPLLLHFLLLA
jgi:hypothetical protein